MSKAFSPPKRRGSQANSVMGSCSTNSVMGSCSRRREDEGSENPGFYKLVDYSVLQERMLKIPQDFYESFEGKVPHQCHIQTFSGTWPVDVKRIREEYFFKTGWREFVVGNCLKLREFIVFHYVGHAEFDVEIYGHNHCRKKSLRLLDDEFDDHDVIVVDSDSDSEPQNTEISLESESERPRELGRRTYFPRRGRARNPATKSRSGNPCFSVQMSPSLVTKGPLKKDSDNDLESRHTNFKEGLMKDLKRPYNTGEHIKLLEDWTRQRPATGHARKFRSGVIKTYALKGEYGKSYLEEYKGLAEMIKVSNRPGNLNLLRGFFYWLKNVAQEGSFEPWSDVECLNVVLQR